MSVSPVKGSASSVPKRRGKRATAPAPEPTTEPATGPEPTGEPPDSWVQGASRPGMIRAASEAPPAAGKRAKPAASGPAWEPDGDVITHATYARKFQRAHKLNDHAIFSIERRKNPVTGEYEPHQKIIWEGEIKVTDRNKTYKISPSRRLIVPQWHEYITAQAIDNKGNSAGATSIAAMDLRQQFARQTWSDKLGVSLSGQLSLIKEFLCIEGLRLPIGLRIMGQGPVKLDDLSPEPGALLDGSLVFVTASGTFDTKGNTRTIEADLGHIPDKCRYYDLTPNPKPDEIREGCELLSLAYDECPNYPEIPAAFIGQQFAGWLAAVDPRLWSMVVLTGQQGSGKSYYALRWDSIQARNSEDTRGDLEAIKPALNLGDTTGTVKGGKYHVVNYGGFVITTDDVLKREDNETRIREQSDKISNLVRSYLAGGAALAKVDYSRQEVTSADSPALHSSIKVLAEKSITGGSTLDRGIVLPHLTESYDKGTVFNLGISDRLGTAEAREAQHRAYSAYVQWAMQRITTDLEECLAKAYAETDTWGVPARTAKRYAALLAGHYMLERYCQQYDVNISEKVGRATLALKANAQWQSRTAIPLAVQAMRDMRDSTQEGYCAWMGPPTGNPSDVFEGLYSVPGDVITVTDADETSRIITRLPDGLTIKDLGLVPWGNTPGPNQRGIVYGHFVTPKTGGRDAKNPLLNRPLLVLKREDFERMCKRIAHGKTYSYEPHAVMRSLRELNKGDVIAMGTNRNKYWVIDATWALLPPDETPEITGEDDQ